MKVISIALYYIFYAKVWLLAWLPFPVLYGISDVLAFFTYHVVRYRRKVVRKNLCNSFPEKSEKELIAIEKKFYAHLLDIFVESLKLLHISEKEIQRRMVFTNIEEMNRLFGRQKNIIGLLGHYGNWEWITSIQLYFPEVIIGEIYRPLKNRYFDRFFLKLRGRFGTLNIPKNDALRTTVRLRQEGKVFGLGFIADQTPSSANLHYWNTFLHQDTPFLNGPERIARKGEYAVVYFDIQKTKRGYYTCEVIPMTENGKETRENEITDKYVELFEKTICREPAYWLWTHKRWKHVRI